MAVYSDYSDLIVGGYAVSNTFQWEHDDVIDHPAMACGGTVLRLMQ